MTRTVTPFTVERWRRFRWWHQLREKSRARSLRQRRNVILPGQIFDGQAGLHDNYKRHYDPATGRYVESDPIGLAGGSYSPYAYVYGDPIDFMDDDGLLGRAPGTAAVGRIPIGFPNTAQCSYYDGVARRSGCKYHAFAGDVCRGKNLGVNFLTLRMANSNLNCIRSCLIESDKKARASSTCQTTTCNSRGQCTKKSCIDSYHNQCFVKCGVPSWLYGGNLPGPLGSYPNDGE